MIHERDVDQPFERIRGRTRRAPIVADGAAFLAMYEAAKARCLAGTCSAVGYDACRHPWRRRAAEEAREKSRATRSSGERSRASSAAVAS